MKLVITEIKRISLFQITIMLQLMPDEQTVTSVTQNDIIIILTLLFSNLFMTSRDLVLHYHVSQDRDFVNSSWYEEKLEIKFMYFPQAFFGVTSVTLIFFIPAQ